MAWYRTGTVAVTNGSRNVTGTGTAWVAGLQAGWGFVGPDGRSYEIEQVVSATAILLRTTYQGSTASGQAYSAFPTLSLKADLAAEVVALIATYQGMVDGPGAGKFPDGTLAAPGLRFAADEDSGIARTAANTLALVAGGVARALLSSTALQVNVPITGAAAVSSDSDVTAGRLLKTGAGPAQAFRRGNILGTVSQTDGVPTGAVVQVTSNANGVCTRFADGTQICQRSANLGSILAEGDGSWTIPYRTAAAFPNFAAPFSVAPVVALAFPNSDGALNVSDRMLAPSGFSVLTTGLSSLRVARVGGTNAAADVVCHITATGRWF